MVQLRMDEFRFLPEPAQVAAGRVVFRLDNRGEKNHQPTLLLVPEDLPPILDQLRGDKRRELDVIANNAGLRPRVSAALAVDLKAGQRYAFVCYVEAGDGQNHGRMGMAWEFRAAEAPSP